MDDKRLYSTLVLVVFGSIIFLLLRDFITGILSAFVLTLLMLPLFRYINKKIPRRIAALLIILILIILLFVLFYFISIELMRQASAYIPQNSIQNTLNQSLDGIIQKWPAVEGFITTFSESIRGVLINIAISITTNIPGIAINILVTFFLTYYLLLNWEDVSVFMKKAFPLKSKEAYSNIRGSFYKIFYGITIIATIEFIIALIGFWIAGVPLYLFLALLVGVAAFVPFFGPMTVWLPMFIYYLIAANYYSAIVVLITGITLTVGVENILEQIIIGRTSKINPGIMMLGILGGVIFFGFFGFIIGPLFLITFIEFFKEYLNAREEDNLRKEES